MNEDTGSSDHPKVYLENLIQFVLEQRNFVGTEDNFHNIVVELADYDYYVAACDFIEKGLLFYPYSVDLLADYINYCDPCHRVEEGKKYFARLSAIEKHKWGERAFLFSYGFIETLNKISNTDAKDSDLSNIIKEYQYHFPASDDAFAMEYDYFESYGTANEKESIKDKILGLMENGTLKKAPMCCVKLARYYLDAKSYDKCLHYLEQCEKNNIQIHPRVKNTYMHTLFIFCKIVMLFEDIGAVMLNSIKDTEKEKVVQEIFTRANIIRNWEEKYCTGNWYKTIAPMIMELSNFTRIPYYENTDTD